MQLTFLGNDGQIHTVGEPSPPRRPKSAKAKTDEEKPHLEFRTCKAKCFACAGCGYVWGPSRQKDDLAGLSPIDSNGRPY